MAYRHLNFPSEHNRSALSIHSDKTEEGDEKSMQQSPALFGFLGFAVTSILGTLLHFLYDLLGGAQWIAPFAATSESTFEHMKLLFWPMLLFGGVEYFFFRDRADFLCIKLRSILLGLALIPILFYTYNGAIGKSPDLVNIAIFFIATGAAYHNETKRLLGVPQPCPVTLSFLLLVILVLLFLYFTQNPLKIGLFRDPMA